MLNIFYQLLLFSHGNNTFTCKHIKQIGFFAGNNYLIGYILLRLCTYSPFTLDAFQCVFKTHLKSIHGFLHWSLSTLFTLCNCDQKRSICMIFCGIASQMHSLPLQQQISEWVCKLYYCSPAHSEITLHCSLYFCKLNHWSCAAHNEWSQMSPLLNELSSACGNPLTPSNDCLWFSCFF